MLIKRRLSLCAEVLDEPVLRREVIKDVWRAEELLVEAQQRADELLQATERQCQQQLADAQAQFWEQANHHLQLLNAQRATLEEEALRSVERLLFLALARLLDDTDRTQRIRALVRQLAENQAAGELASLSCHPEQAPAVRAWLADSRLAAVWNVQEDADLDMQALRLSHGQGALDINWNELRRGLLGESSADVASPLSASAGTHTGHNATQDIVTKKESRDVDH